MSSHADLQIISPAEIDMLSSLREIYDTSFAADSRRVFDSVVELAKANPDFNFYAIVRDGKPVGLLSDWQLGEFVFIEHFAVAQNYRGWGIGQQIMETWLEKQSLPVVVEVEKPEDDTSIRRIAFYQRMGFQYWRVDYMQPAYDIDKHPVPLHLMTFGGINLEEALESVRQKLYQKVYAQALHP